jgi:2-polyprenyl-3-methyl-5-hydroxy-6-metoxy-1,4-benzoquinol methylase
MERDKWLKLMQSRAETLYNRFSYRYWDTWGIDVPDTHRKFLNKFLNRITARGIILSAACGAGRFDGFLLEAGHTVIGIDQSDGVLAKAKERYPKVKYKRMVLQEMDFNKIFDGIICMDAMEHISPEDYPVILLGFQKALKPGGALYFTADREEEPDFDLNVCYEKGKAQGLPIVFGEVADDAAYEQAMAQLDASDELTDRAVYHYYPPLKVVREWINHAGLVIEEEGAGGGFHHFILRKA